VLPQYYRINNGDNPAVMAIIYEYFYNDSRYPFLLADLGYYDAKYTGVIASDIYGRILHIIGWTKLNSYLISTLFMLLAVTVWVLILKKVSFDRYFIFIFIIYALLFEPFYAIGHQTRSDSFAFLFASLSFYLFMNKRFFLSALILCISMETHPIGASGAFYCLAYLIAYPHEYLKDRKYVIKSILLLFLGIIAGVFIYIALHYEYLSGYFSNISKGLTADSIISRNYILAYFFDTRYYRHIPELLIFLAALAIFFKQKIYKKENKYKFALILFTTVLLSTLILSRGSTHYMVFIFPSILMIIITVAMLNKKIWLINLVLLIILAPQYGMMYYEEHNYQGMNAYIETVKDNLPQDLPIYGNFNMWFAFMDKRDFRHYSRLSEHIPYPRFIVAGKDDTPGWTPIKPYVNNLADYSCNAMPEFQIQKDIINIWDCYKR